jgi:endonuclease G
LRKIFPLLLYVSIAWVPFSRHPDDPGASALRDSLVKFRENFVPSYSADEEIVKHTAFTLCYSEQHEQAKWIAYRLTRRMCNNNGEERTNNFRIDPLVKSGSASPADYKKSGFDRGHLCPAGDMGWSEETMSESFLMSNMSPQEPAFNRGIWKNLESLVRQWAVEDMELYIVTAGVLPEELPYIGSNKVSVPEYYYKIVLDVNLPDLKAIAFIMPNKGSKAGIFEYAVSIDSVEHLTGIDFYPALPDSLENHLESNLSIKNWK